MVKSIIINSLIVALAVLLQSTVMHYVAVNGVIPDLVLIFVLFISLKEGSRKGEITGFAGGLLVDILSLAPLGFHCIVYTVVGFVSGLTEKNVSTESPADADSLYLSRGTVIKYFLFSVLIVVFSIENHLIRFSGKKLFYRTGLYHASHTPHFYSVKQNL